jgi:hypothetical protein
MDDIYVSFALEDRGRVRLLIRSLEDCGWRVRADDNPETQLMRADGHVGDEAVDAGCVLVIWSSFSIDSLRVNALADVAQHPATLVSARFDEAMPPSRFSDAPLANMPGWPGDPGDLQRLLGAIDASLSYTTRATEPTELAEVESGGPMPLDVFRSNSLYGGRGPLVIGLILGAVVLAGYIGDRLAGGPSHQGGVEAALERARSR